MKILITGANGFLGHYLSAQLLDKGYELVATGKGPSRLALGNRKGFVYEELDFTDPFAVHDIFEKYQPGIIVHAGAMTKPDDCELQQWPAYLTNVEGTVTLLLNAEEQKSFFVFISTDFVFNGDKGYYQEDDSIMPVNFYGKTKAEAEDAVKEYEYEWAIVRTSLVYGIPVGGRGNLLTVVKEKLEKGEEYKVVDDQVRTPTYVEDLAAGIVSIIEKKAKGIYHLSGEEVLTPYQMACQTADYLQLDSTLIKKVTAADFSQPARRPLRTNFLIDRAKKKLGYLPVDFKTGLEKTFPGH
ncbi:MAG: SDR family oxidoreductase [Bacteroidota bacterium]|nr:SDR family oxidoreductase [Bacteroidota bacterium]